MTVPCNLLGNSEHSLFPPAPRGVPQIEVMSKLTGTGPVSFCGDQDDKQEHGHAFTKHGVTEQRGG